MKGDMRKMGKRKKLTPKEKLLAGALGVAMFPVILTLEAHKEFRKKKYKKRKKKIKLF